VIDETKAQWMNALLYDVVQSGTGTAARVPGHEVAGKTGTNSEFRDAWFVGYSADFVTGVWVGNDDYSPMVDVTGGELPAEIWSRFMRAALKGRRAHTIRRKLPGVPINLTAAIDVRIAPPGLIEAVVPPAVATAPVVSGENPQAPPGAAPPSLPVPAPAAAPPATPGPNDLLGQAGG
jgi:penicillin-binding protein 1A